MRWANLNERTGQYFVKETWLRAQGPERMKQINGPELWLPDQPHGPGLWLPDQPVDQQHGSPLDHFFVILGYKEVYGEEASWDLFKELISGYSLEGICRMLTRLGILLHRARMDAETQLQVTRGMFREQEDLDKVLSAKVELENDRGKSKVVIFSELQLAAFWKAALLCKDLGDTNDEESYSQLGKALLVINNLMETGSLAQVAPEDDDFTERWTSFLVSNSLFNVWEFGAHPFARYYDLQFTDRQNLRECGSYIDLPRMFEETTGVEPLHAWGLLFSIVCNWYLIEDVSDEDAPYAIDLDSYFTNFDFLQDEVDRYLSLCVTSIEDLQTTVREKYSLDDLSPCHVLPLTRHPYVRFENRIYCPILKFGMEKFTTGLHHFFLDPSIPSSQRDRYLTYRGEVFGDYTEQMLDRCYPETSGRYLALDKIRGKLSGKFCDGLVDLGGAIALIETKASLLPLGARSGTDPEKLEKRFKDIFLDAAEQIQATIAALRDGKLTAYGFPAAASTCYPIILTLEDISLNPVVYREIDRTFTEAGLLHQEGVRPWQCIDVGEFEQIEVALNTGYSLMGLLDAKIGDSVGCYESFTNFAHRREYGFWKENNDHHLKIFDELTQEFIRLHARCGRKELS